MPLNDWTIFNASLADLGITEAVMEFASQDVDRLTLTLDGRAGDAGALWPKGKRIVLRDAQGQRRFTGSVEQPYVAAATGAVEGQQVVIESDWRRMQRRTWLVDRPYDDSPGLDTRVLLGGRYRQVRGPDGKPLVEFVPRLVARSIEEACAYVGVDSSIDVGGKVPPFEVDGVTPAEAVKMMLRLYPGAVTWWDYSKAEPVLHAAQPDRLGAFSRRLDQLDGLPAVRPTVETVLPGVRIIFRKFIVGDGAREELTYDEVGDVEADGALTVAIDLAPEVHSLEVASLEIDRIAPRSLEWWRRHVPELDKWMDQPGFTGPILPVVQRDLPPGLKYELVSGSFPASFVERGCSGAFGKYEKILRAANGTTAELADAIIRGAFSISDALAPQEVQLAIQATNLDRSGRWASEDRDLLDPGEDPKEFEGLAARVYRCSQRLGHEGSASWVGPKGELDLPPLGKTFSITGSANAAWSTMRSPIHMVRQTLSTGRTEIEFGPSAYLGPTDLVEIIRGLKRPERRRPPAPIRRDQDGATPPPPQSVNTPGGGSRVPATYDIGRLTVNIGPSAISAALEGLGATWTLASANIGWQRGGATVDVPEGDHRIIFSPLLGATAPAPIAVKITAGNTETKTGTYALEVYTYFGTLMTPAEAEAALANRVFGLREFFVVNNGNLSLQLMQASDAYPLPA